MNSCKHQQSAIVGETLASFQILYGDCETDAGDIVVVSPDKRYPLGVYRLDQLEQAARTAASVRGAYFKVNLFDVQKMKRRQAEKRLENPNATVVGGRDEVKTVVGFFLDVDANKPGYLSRDEALHAIGQMPVRPTMIVNSNGDHGGFHPYWLLTNPFLLDIDLPRCVFIDAAKRWQARLKRLMQGKLDSTANIDRVLRVIGSLRPNGNRVSVHEYSGQKYSFSDLYIPYDLNEVQSQARHSVRAELREMFGDSQTGRPVDDYVSSTGITPESLLLEAGYESIDQRQFRRPGSESGCRSVILSDQKTGINVFSGGDTRFDAVAEDGSAGRFYSTSAMFVALRFNGDWNSAASWCSAQLLTSDCDGVDLSGLGVRS